MTQRSLMNFKVGKRMPTEIIRAFAYLKMLLVPIWSRFKPEKAYIMIVCDQILNGELDENFPLVVYQTGSGTQDQHECKWGHCRTCKRWLAAVLSKWWCQYVLWADDILNCYEYASVLPKIEYYQLKHHDRDAQITLEEKYMKVKIRKDSIYRMLFRWPLGRKSADGDAEHDYDNIVKSLMD